MAGVARVGLDSAGGVQLGLQAPTVFANGANVVVLGDQVAAHGPPPHTPPPTMVSASGSVYAHGKWICRAGDAASCGHATSGSSNVFAG